MSRSDLLSAMRAASAAYARGDSAPAELAALQGRRFAVKVAFGCGWPQTEDGRTGYRLDPERETLKVTVVPQDWTSTPWAAALANGREIEAAEGFWIRRPWLDDAACPTVVAKTGAAPSPEVAGLAQLFEAGGSRLIRRGARPYEVTRRIPQNAPPADGGFRLTIEGRIVEAGGRPVRCLADHPDQRPACIVLVQFDRVAIETAAGELLGEWRS